jgi:hypothetical protein
VTVPFKALEGYEDEFARQLAGQESALNGMTAGEIKGNIETFNLSGRSSDAADAIGAFRRSNPVATDPFAENYLPNAGNDPVTFAALHEPDMVIGGRTNGVTGYGDMRVNSSIGAQNYYNQQTILDAVSGAPSDSYIRFIFDIQGPK